MKYSKATSEQITDRRRLLQNPVAFLNDAGDFDGVVQNKRVDGNQELLHPYAFIDDAEENSSQHHKRSGKESKRYAWIERKAHELHINIWKRRHQLLPEGVPADPVQLLDPSIAIQCIGYEYDLAEDLGEFLDHGSNSKIAGIIDRSAKRISISRSLPYKTLRFTAAHEIGHALLHRETLMHRDRPIDGSAKMRVPRETIEIEADKFATYFLMPAKLIRERFESIFGVRGKFSLTDDTAFALDPAGADDLIYQCKSLRDLTRILANTGRYNGRQVNSLAVQFGVSGEAMAIRIEELGLAEV